MSVDATLPPPLHSLTHDDEVDEGAEARVVCIPLREACQVLHLVQAGHGEEDGLVAVLQLACRGRGRAGAGQGRQGQTGVGRGRQGKQSS